MVKKVVFALLFALLLGSASVAFAEIKVDGDAYVGVFDKYLWRGYDLSGSTPVAQGGIDLSAHNLTLSYWTNVQLKDDHDDKDPTVIYGSGEANETDITIDYSLDLGEQLTLNVGNIYYTMDGTMGGIEDTNELYLSATLNTLLEPKLTTYYDWDENKDARFYTLELAHAIELGKVTLNAGALASYADNDDSHEPWNAELSLSADLAVTEQISITPSFLYSAPLGNDAQEAIDTEMVAGLTVSHSF